MSTQKLSSVCGCSVRRLALLIPVLAVVTLVTTPAHGIRRVVGGAGVVAPLDANRSVVIVSDETNAKGFCSATLILPNVFLTASHCANGSDDLLGVPGGAITPHFETVIVNTRTYHVLGILHPDYNVGNLGNDIALLLADTHFNSATFPVADRLAVIATDQAGNAAVGNNVTAVGFGSDEYVEESPGVFVSLFGTRRSTAMRMTAFGPIAAAGVPAGTIEYKIIPAPGGGAPRAYVEHGDSGGPSLITVDGNPVVAGVHSYGNEQAAGAPPAFPPVRSVDTRVSSFAQFVRGEGAPGQMGPRRRLVSWNTNDNDNWNNAARWLPAGRPADHDVVNINRRFATPEVGNPTVTVNIQTAQLDGLLNNNTILIDAAAAAGAQLRVDNGGGVSSPGLLNAKLGTIIVGRAGAGETTGTLIVSSLDNQGTLDVLRNGALQATQYSNNAGTMTIRGAANIMAKLRNEKVCTTTGDTIAYDPTITDRGSLTLTELLNTGNGYFHVSRENGRNGLVTVNGNVTNEGKNARAHNLTVEGGTSYADRSKMVITGILNNAADVVAADWGRIDCSVGVINNTTTGRLIAGGNGKPRVYVATLNNRGTVQASSEGFIYVEPGGVLNNAAGGYLQVTDNAWITTYNLINWGRVKVRATARFASFSTGNVGKIDVDPSVAIFSHSLLNYTSGYIVGDGEILCGGDVLNYSTQAALFNMAQLDLRLVDPETFTYPSDQGEPTDVFVASPADATFDVHRLIWPSIDLPPPSSPTGKTLYVGALTLMPGPIDNPATSELILIDGSPYDVQHVTTLDVRGGVIYVVGGMGNVVIQGNCRVTDSLNPGRMLAGGIIRSVSALPSNNYAMRSLVLDGANYVALTSYLPLPPPPNDSCINVFPVGSAPTIFDSSSATTDGPPMCAAAGADIWFCYTAECTGTATFSLCGSSFDTVMAIYAGCGCPAGAPLACADGGCGSNAEISLAVIADQSYLLQVAGVGGATGIGTLAVTCSAPIANDNCSGAIEVGVPLVVAGTTVGATVDSTAPSCGLAGAPTGPGVWYRLTGPGSTVTASLCDSAEGFDSKISIFCGSCEGLVCITGDDDACGNGHASVTWCPQAGADYLILVHGPNPVGGAFALTLSDNETPCTPGGPTCPLPPGPIRYVRQGAANGGNGRSWATAYNRLQDALAEAADPNKGIGEIWVAAGVYKPAGSGGPRSASFVIPPGVGVYGGFAGNETQRSQRNATANATILSSDLNADDGPNFAGRGDNGYHVVSCTGGDNTTVLDGFAITGGNANGSDPHDRGGGLLIESGSPVVRTCVFSGNSADYGGGGLYARNSSNPLVSLCNFDGNRGTGVCGSCGGAGCYFEYGTIATLFNCSFTHNTLPTNAFPGGNGSGVIYRDNCGGLVVNTLFAGNSGLTGALVVALNSNVQVVNCTLRDNSASFQGGGLYMYQAIATLRNCILWGNTAPNGAGPQIALNSSPSTVDVDFSDVQGGQAQVYVVNGGSSLVYGGSNINQDPSFANAGGGELAAGSPCINAGSNAALPPDSLDIDGDGDTGEPTPLDLYGNARILQNVIEMGVHEAGPPVGACCYGAGLCAAASLSDCTFLYNGTYQGDGTNCAPQLCPANCLRGDANGDGFVNNFDIDPFVLALTDFSSYVVLYCGGNLQLAICRTDINQDGGTNNFDIDPFVLCVTGGCP